MRPALQLAGFARIELDPQETKSVTFTVPASLLGYTNIDNEFVVDPGPVRWFLGFDADDHVLQGSFELVGDIRHLSSADRSFLSDVVVSDG